MKHTSELINGANLCKGRIVWLLGIVILALTPLSALAVTDTFPASNTWQCPAGVTSVTINAWGAGGGGAGGTGAATTGGGGGGGGQFVSHTVSVTPLATYNIVVGTAGTGGAVSASGVVGGDTTFDGTTVVAKGGSGGNINFTGGAGGSGGTWDASFSGGTGGNGAAGVGGGGGGGGAGSGGAGANGIGTVGGSGGTPDGGVGGNGSTSNSATGTAGSQYGGGGGAGTRNAAGAAGAVGYLTITYTPAALPTVQWTAANQASANEVNGTTLTVTAQLSASSASTVTVPFSVSGTATGSGTDFNITASPITINPGNTTGTATITIVGDTLDENNETVILTMGTPTNATLGATTVHTATITDDDATPTVQWTAASQASANETNGTTMTVTAQLSAASGLNVSVPFTVTGSATGGGTDYTITASPIAINAGSTTGTATITIVGDALSEGNETVILTIGSPTNATASGTTVHTATITDDDGPVCTQNPMTVTVTPATQNVRAGLAITYNVMVTNNDSVECSPLNITLSRGDAGDTGDFDPSGVAPTSLNGVAPQSSASATLTVTAKAVGVEGRVLTTTVTAAEVGHTSQIDTAVSTIMNYNPLIHSSKSTNSTKWGVNGWGVAGGRYGEFTCATCHVKNATPNIKRIKQTITTSPETIPGSGQTVTFTTTTDTTANFAESAGNHATSNKICEVCHTYDAAKTNGTQFHGYNMSAASAGDQAHYLGSDCVKCHVHKQGFKASCDTCHANPPISAAGLVVNGSTPADATGSTTYGKHDKHVNTLAYDCNTCHTGWQTNGEMPKTGNINIGFSTFGSTTGTYAGRSTGKGYTPAVGTTVTATNALTCAVYCHGSTIGGSAVASVWLHTDTLACGDCHNATAAVPPTLVNHPRHAGNGAGQLGLSCDKCHGSPVPTLGDAHLNGKVAWNVTGLSGTIGRIYNSAISGETVNRAPSGSYSTCNNIYCHSNVQSSNGTAAASVYAAPTWGAASVTCDSCHGQAGHGNGQPSSGSHEIHVTTRGIVCSACHTGAGDETAAHANNLINVSIPATYGATAAYTQPAQAPGSGGYGTCSNVTCHNNKTTLTWGATGSCTMCHTAGGAAADPTTGLHTTTNLVAHDDTFGASATCTSCHSTSPSTLHFDGTFQLGGGAATYNWNTGNIPSGYVRATDSCAPSLAGCHSDVGTWNRRWVWAKTNDVAWNYADNAASAPVCGNCHGSFFTGWNIVGATSHVNPSVLNDPDTLATSKLAHGECSKCHTWGHANYIGANNKHENNSLEMNSALGYVDGACSTNCHSPLTLTFTDFNSGWTDATVAGDGVACGDCHNGGVKPGLPGSESGAHAAHGADVSQLSAGDGGLACVPCHGNNGGAGFYSSLSGTHGIGNVVNFATNLTYSAARGVLNGTCSGTAGCHVSNATNAMWDKSNLTNCNQCHQNTADINNWGWTGTAAGNISMISSTEYTAVGHGQATINGAAASKACMDCHDLSQAHDTSATLTGGNPFRLKAAFTCNSIVAGCHTVTGLLGTHDQATAGAKYTWTFGGTSAGAKCVDCHDPHGDGSNLSMIHSDLADKGSADNWVRLTPDAGIETMVFTNTTGIAADSYAEGATTFDGICQECHTQTTSMQDNTITNGANHTATTGCIGCHGHDVGFKASGCNGCHGGDNATINNKNFWPGGAGASYPDRTGEHNIHIQRLATKLGYPFNDTLTDQQQKTMCAYCHPYTTDPGESGHYEGASGTAPADVTAAAFNPLWSTLDATPYPNQADTGTAAGYTGGNGTGGSCSGIDCHNDNTTPTTHEWYDGATSTCVMCHTPGGTGRVPLASGLHKPGTLTSSTPHDDSFGSGPATCTSNCHMTIGAVGGTASTHADGINAGNTVAALGLPSVNNFYTQTSTAGNGSGTCSGTGTTIAAAGCHGIDPIDAGTWVRKWDDTISYANNGITECAGCHGGFGASDWTFGGDNVVGAPDYSVSHARDWDGASSSNDGAEVIGNHSGSTTATKCNICHVYGDSAYVWGTNHRDRKITMNSRVVYNNTAFNCSTNCHTEPWGNTNHSMEAASTGNWTTRGSDLLGPALACVSCHSAIYNAGAGTHIDADGPGTTYQVGITAGLCEACHGTGAGATAGHWVLQGTAGTNRIGISTLQTRSVNGSGEDTGTLIPTMNKQYSSHDSYILLGGTATNSATTEAQMCWGCHDAVTTASFTLTGTNVTFTSPATIAATGINTKFPVGRWITIFGSSNYANNRTFKVASVGTNTLTVTIPAGSATLASVASAAGVTIVSPISEWQVNENTATGTLAYDYGMLFTDATTVPGTRTSDWTTGVWRSGKGLAGGATGRGAYNPAWYKKGAIQSTHAANIGGTFTAAITAGNSLGYNRTETKDAVANIRCSNCHDVHGTHDGVNGDVAGAPYLRGTWTGNQYPEDLAPQWLMANWTVDAPTGNSYGRVPRGSALATNSGLAGEPKAGGFWIDQNSGNPTGILESDTLATREAKATSTAGLCDQCHGTTRNGTWTSAEISAIDQVTSEGLWVSGYNGHANAVVGGAGRGANSSAESYARNIFTRTKRGSATQNYAREFTPKVNVDMGLATEDDRGYSYRSNSSGYGLFYYPRTSITTTNAAGTNASYAFRYFVWNTAYYSVTRGSAIATGTMALQVANLNSAATATNDEPATYDAQANYHTFTCAKCHNPHASRLPKLMITNCLDTNHNTWDNEYQAAGAIGAPWASTRLSQWASAQNCHRLDDKAPLATSPTSTRGLGWNKATPWQEYTTPDTLPSTNPNP